MLEYALPVLYAVFVWWLATGVLLYLHRLPRHTHRWSVLGMTVMAAAAFYGHGVSAAGSDAGSALLAFTCGVTLWGWLELGYFTGLLAGPRQTPCPARSSQWQRFQLAVRTGLYHEIAILATAAVLVLTARDAPNQAGVWSFVVLWLMRWSAKLNLFLGVPNLNEHWLPEHLRFLSTYMLKRPMNLLFPVSVSAATVVLVLLLQQASGAEPGSLDRVGLLLAASLLALGILEHWFLVLSFSEEALWRWALRSDTSQATGSPDRLGPGKPAPPRGDADEPRNARAVGAEGGLPRLGPFSAHPPRSGMRQSS